ncbi:MAG: ATP-binding protein [Bacteroidia bacterium]|nr:ATP-binding protein [Bacteroidia bacterium]
MEIFTHRIFTHRKIIFIFLFAIFLPSLIVGYLSLTTFSNRREAVKKILESNLWISGEAGLKSVEDALSEQEKNALISENFIRLTGSIKAGQTLDQASEYSKDFAGQFFLLNADFKIVFPETGSENTWEIQLEKEMSITPFAQLFQRAESFEFYQNNYARAAELYKECSVSAPSKQHRAMALESLGRCLLSSNKYDEANKVYNELSKNYGQFQNKAGHPYGIIAAFQLYQVSQEKKEEENCLGILLGLYKELREGIWLINVSVYDFYIAEIESILNSRFNEGKFPEIQKSYLKIQKTPSPYRQALIFSNFLEKNTIPKIKEKFSLARPAGEFVPERMLINSEKDFLLVSYTILPNFQPEQNFYGGFFWDLKLLKNQVLPKMLEDITKDSGLDFKIVDDKGQNITTGKEEVLSKESLTLTFRMFPLTWKLLVTLPEIKVLEKAARREIFFYGVLLTVIIALMLLGAVLIVRDISRESETTRLKTEFVHNITHELKTPLTLIRLYGETLQRKENLTNEEKKDCYEIITKESERLSHLINNVLDFSRIETGRKEFDFKNGDLAAIIRDTLESYRYHLEKKGFVIHKDIRDLPEMNFDGEAIASVLINLLSNAMKFSPKEKVVTVKLFRDDGNAVIQVADKGIGISPAEVPKIFQRFYQSENKMVTERRGSGLGLTLVKHITEAHNGTIQVESEPGKGSIFSVILPITFTEKHKT